MFRVEKTEPTLPKVFNTVALNTILFLALCDFLQWYTQISTESHHRMPNNTSAQFKCKCIFLNRYDIHAYKIIINASRIESCIIMKLNEYRSDNDTNCQLKCCNVNKL